MRHAVPVDRGAGPGHVCRARDADALAPPLAERAVADDDALRERGALVAPSGGLDDLVDALAEADRRDGQVVRGLRERIGDDAPPEVGGIEPELLGRLVELTFQREAWLRRAVPALRSARRLVGEDARALE